MTALTKQCKSPKMTLGSIEIKLSEPNSAEANALINELSETLAKITGRDGRDSFSSSDVTVPRSLFLIAYQDEQPVGCGALRPVNDETCEIKRMYTREQNKGVGQRILAELEKGARDLKYKKIILETGIQNETAINFYLRNGYSICEKFGKYVGRPECVCFDKVIRE